MLVRDLITRLQEIVDSPATADWEKQFGALEVYVDAFEEGQYKGLSPTLHIQMWDLGLMISHEKRSNS